MGDVCTATIFPGWSELMLPEEALPVCRWSLLDVSSPPLRPSAADAAADDDDDDDAGDDDDDDAFTQACR